MTAVPPPPRNDPPDWDDEAADLAALFARTAPEPPPVDAAALRTSLAPVRSRFRRSLVMKLSAAVLAAAAAAFAAVWLNPTPAEAKVMTFQDVQEAVSKAGTVAFSRFVPGPDGGEVLHTKTVMDRGQKWARHEARDGTVTIIDRNADRVLITRPKNGAVETMSATAWGPPPIQDFYGTIYDRRSSDPVEVTLAGRPALRFDVEPDKDGSGPLTVWVAPETRLPVRTELMIGDDRLVLKDFEFSEAVDARLLDVSLPEPVLADLARVTPPDPFEGLPPNTYALGAEPPPEPIDPDLVAFGAAFGPLLSSDGLGPVQFGMSRAEVEAAVGVPCFSVTPGEFWLWIPSRAITARGTDADGVVQVWAGTAGWAPLVLPFTGRTVGGVTAGMSGEEVERRLGGPDRVEEREANTGPYGPVRVSDRIRYYSDRRIAVWSSDPRTQWSGDDRTFPDIVGRVTAWSPAVHPPPPIYHEPIIRPEFP